LKNRFVDYGTVLPIKYHVGTTHTRLNHQQWTNTTTISLSKSAPVLTLDFGYEVAGFPFFTTTSQSSATQLEFAYSESFASLDSPYSDGPWTFSNGLSNTFRIETFNVTKPGYLESFFVQGGQRWAVVKLLTDNDVMISSVG